ncbi:ExbD/TolR family protein [Lysobacter niastensis]|uniref:Biopolymer transporter ExbD n=1 Tax=Lysobacter niastensis TaxID=380629 RepID=A0ABS0B418_9GAMM|nr:biopolymer transporter ExbD [Lysobacter niastensis]MBF6023266.1 biopolymer transporter ExbD [Lysobacter niastensis]
MAVSAFPSDSRQRRDVAEINITPLVDVLLVLLVIFMVTAPAMTGRMDLRLPQAAPPDQREPPPRVELRVQAHGGYLLDGRAIAADELPDALNTVARAEPSSILQISAADDADYQAFASALAQAQRSGLSNISMQ